MLRVMGGLAALVLLSIAGAAQAIEFSATDRAAAAPASTNSRSIASMEGGMFSRSDGACSWIILSS
jgi:predicted outer membrane protein